MASRFRVARLGALVAVVLAALLATAMPAAAEVAGKYTGTVPGGAGHGFKMEFGGDVHDVYASLLGIDLDGDSKPDLSTYCVEIDVDAIGGADMVEKSWADFPGDDAVAQPDKVLWVLHHSYPSITVDELRAASGANNVDTKDAITGTQAAIWHFANGANLSQANPAVTKIYEYLTGDANEGMEEQPAASLSITPGEIKDVEAGSKAGEFTLSTNAKNVKVALADGTPEGVKIVDEAGVEITQFDDGTKFWLSAPAGEAVGAATVKAEAKAQVEKGRLFVGKSDKHRTQTLIVAASNKGKAKAEASAKWVEKAVPPPPSTTTVPPTTTTEVAPTTTTEVAPSTTTAAPAPSTTVAPPPQGGNLPVTGTTILPVLGIGLLLLGAGVGLVLLQRRRANS